MQPKVSIIIPFLNGMPYLTECIRSVQAQTLSEIEIILVDDGSTDESGAAADAFAAQDDRIRVLHQANAGVSTARNNALAIAKGQYIGFVDADDLAKPDMYETLYTAAVENRCDIVSAAYTSFDEKRTLFESPPPFPPGTVLEHREIEALTADMYSKGTFLFIWRRLFSAELIRRNGITFIPEISIGEDSLFCLHCFLCASRVLAIPDRVYMYRHQENSAMRSKKYKPNLFPSIEGMYLRQKALSETLAPTHYNAFLRDAAEKTYHFYSSILLTNAFKKPEHRYAAYRQIVRSKLFADSFRYYTPPRSRSLDTIMMRLIRCRLRLPAYCIGLFIFRNRSA